MKVGLKLLAAVVLAVVVAVVGWRLLHGMFFRDKRIRGVPDDSVLRMTDDPQTNTAGTAARTGGGSGVAGGGALPRARDALSSAGMLVEEAGDDWDGADGEEEEDEEETPAERAVREWEELAENLMEAGFGEGTDANLSKKIKTAFDALETEQDKLDGIQAMMNLISDGAVQSLIPILLDTSYDEDILDIIFNDILNRDDEIKYPILEEIAKDPTHPNFVDAAHILEVTKPDEGPVVVEEEGEGEEE